MTDQPLAVTDDLYLRRPGITDPADADVLREGYRVVSTDEFLEIMESLDATADRGSPVDGGMTPDQIRAMCLAAREASHEFARYVVEMVDLGRAAEVRELRCVGRYSWRALASELHRRWRGTWTPASNQLLGVEVCERAAVMLGEDPHSEPWNDC